MDERKDEKKEPAWLGLDSLNGKYLFGIDEAPNGRLVAPGQTAKILVRPHTLFRGERLFVKRDCASSFLIRDVFVGQPFPRRVLRAENLLRPEDS